MNVYIAILIPIFISVLAWIFFSKKIVWWETLLPIVFGLIFIFGTKSCMQHYNTSATEYLSTHVTKACFEEEWNEYIHKTCSTEHCSGTGKNRTCYTTYYDCSYVEFHPEQYYLVDSKGSTFSISRDYYYKLTKDWNNKTFIDMHRHYHTINGNMYQTEWKGDINNVIASNWSESYENRVQASHSIYNYKDIDDGDKIEFRLFDYPKIDGYYQPSIIQESSIASQEDINQFNAINALLGPKKQVRVWLVLWENAPKKCSEYQQSYWKGGNKNELVICLNVNKKKEIQWEHIFTWSDKSILKIKIRDYLAERKGKPLNVIELRDFLYTEIDKDWVRKNFHDFDFLIVELTSSQLTWLYLLVTLFSLGIVIWTILNPFDNDNSPTKKTTFNKYLFKDERFKKSRLDVEKQYKSVMSWIRKRMGVE